MADGRDSRPGRRSRVFTETTNSMGEWTFTSLMPFAGRYALKASYTGGNGATMVGFRSIDVVDRTASYTTMTGRTITWDGRRYVGDQNEIDERKDGGALDLPIVPAILGSGITGPPSDPPAIAQIDVAAPSAESFVVGEHNAVHLPNDTNYFVGSASGLVTIGGGLDSQVAARQTVARRGWANPFQQFADWLTGILGGTQQAIESGEGTVAENTSAADKAQIAETVDTLVQNGAQPASGLISDKGLGLIGQAGGNLIGQAGGNVISTGGLNLIGQAGGNVISTGGLNLISDKGLGRVVPGRAATGQGIRIGDKNVISLEKDMMPVYGGNVIATP